MKEKEMLKALRNQGICADSVKMAPKGTAMETYFVKCGKDKFVLKLHHSWSKRRVQKLIGLLLKINSKKEMVVHPLRKKVLKVGREYGYMYRFFEGKSFQDSNVKNKLFQFGELHGEFSKIVGKIKVKQTKEDRGWTTHFFEHALQCADEAIKECEGKGRYYGKISSLLKKGARIIKDCKLGNYRMGLIHGDMHMNNVFYNPKLKSSLIFDNSCIGRGIIAAQITVPLSYELTNSDKKNSQAIKVLIKGYTSKFKLTNKEKKVIPDFILVRKIGEVNYLLWQHKSGLRDKRFKDCMKNSLRQLDIAIRHYGKLQKIFSLL